ncbi:hypothetical protein [Marinilabilia salmonicolor]|uniref:Uncharacterized protein n=1 Tax=Marinilabilia salmonicolor TaxID=989 RepID=A0A368UKH9_9BACT|nr:hypothetical protein [Marinilabilia salmonicolor]RCW19816.1 hypothetical protein DFO77_1711 [Marinilabilia salmonicolor]
MKLYKLNTKSNCGSDFKDVDELRTYNISSEPPKIEFECKTVVATPEKGYDLELNWIVYIRWESIGNVKFWVKSDLKLEYTITETEEKEILKESYDFFANQTRQAINSYSGKKVRLPLFSEANLAILALPTLKRGLKALYNGNVVQQLNKKINE